MNVFEKFGIRVLNDYQREAITQFVDIILVLPIDFRGNLCRMALSISKSAYDWFSTRQWGKGFHTP